MKDQTHLEEEKKTDKNTATIQKLKWAYISLWILQISLGIMFVMAGGLKLMGGSDMVTLFDNIGFGQWFRYVTGILEIVAAVLIIIPALSAIGALLLSTIMLGAVLTHLLLIGGSITMPIAYLIFSLIVVWNRRN